MAPPGGAVKQAAAVATAQHDAARYHQQPTELTAGAAVVWCCECQRGGSGSEMSSFACVRARIFLQRVPSQQKLKSGDHEKWGPQRWHLFHGLARRVLAKPDRHSLPRGSLRVVSCASSAAERTRGFRQYRKEHLLFAGRPQPSSSTGAPMVSPRVILLAAVTFTAHVATVAPRSLGGGHLLHLASFSLRLPQLERPSLPLTLFQVMRGLSAPYAAGYTVARGQSAVPYLSLKNLPCHARTVVVWSS